MIAINRALTDTIRILHNLILMNLYTLRYLTPKNLQVQQIMKYILTPCDEVFYIYTTLF